MTTRISLYKYQERESDNVVLHELILKCAKELVDVKHTILLLQTKRGYAMAHQFFTLNNIESENTFESSE